MSSFHHHGHRGSSSQHCFVNATSFINISHQITKYSRRVKWCELVRISLHPTTTKVSDFAYILQQYRDIQHHLQQGRDLTVERILAIWRPFVAPTSPCCLKRYSKFRLNRIQIFVREFEHSKTWKIKEIFKNQIKKGPTEDPRVHAHLVQLSSKWESD